MSCTILILSVYIGSNNIVRRDNKYSVLIDNQLIERYYLLNEQVRTMK